MVPDDGENGDSDNTGGGWWGQGENDEKDDRDNDGKKDQKSHSGNDGKMVLIIGRKIKTMMRPIVWVPFSKLLSPKPIWEVL